MRIHVAFDVQDATQVLDADHVVKCGLIGLSELQKTKRVHREPVIPLDWQDPDRDI